MVEPELLSEDVEGQVAALAPRELVVAIVTFENAATVATVAAATREGLEKHFQGVPALVVNVDAGSSDATAEHLKDSGLSCVTLRHDAPVSERAAVPFHGVPGRNAAFRLAFRAARGAGARVLLLLEADVTSVSDEWIERLARPVLEGQADLVLGAHARRRYDGTITNLLLAPLTRALIGRRLHQPLAGASALSARVLERLLVAPRWPAPRESMDLWLIGQAAAEPPGIQQVWLGPRRVESRTRASDLPSLLAQAVGGVFALMESAPSLWLDVRGSEPVGAGDPPEPLDGGPTVEISRLLEAFQRGVRDLMPIWESVLAPETLGDVLGLDASDALAFRFPDDVWARVIYDAALGHHYGVIHREHLLKALVPLYLGRTAAFILSTRSRSAAGDGALLEQVGSAFETQKPYLRDRWR